MDTESKLSKTCWICLKENPWRLLNRKSWRWREVDFSGLVEEVCGEVRREFFERPDCSVCINCVNFLPRCLDFLRKVRGQKGPGKRCSTTPQSTQKRLD